MPVRRALAQTLLARQGVVVLAGLSVAVLARLLTPEEFGRFAIAMAAYGVAATIAGFGLKPKLIRAAVVDHEERRSAVGLCLVLSTAAAGLLFGAALLVGPMGAPGLGAPLAVLALALMVAPVVMPLEAALERELDFGALSVLAVAQAAVHLVVAVSLALAGFGATALAVAVLIERVATAAALLLRPGRGAFPAPRFRGWSRFTGFGARLSATQLAPKLGDAALMATFASLVGVAGVGLYNRAERIVKLFDETVLEGVKPVVLPALSRSIDAGAPPSRLYLVKVEHLSAVSWPAFAVIAILAEPLVGVLLGPQWDAAVPVAQALALIGVAKPFTSMSLKLFVALDRTSEILKIHVAHQALRLCLASGGALASLEAACLGIAAALWVKALVLSRAVKRATAYDERALIRILARSALITAAAVAGPIYATAFAPALGDVGRLALGGGLAGVGWLAAAAALRHPLLSEALTAIGARRPAAWLARP